MNTKYLQIHDLANTLRLIDVAAKQGLFSGDQLMTIGSIRERFNAELKEQAPSEDNVANIADADEEPKVEASSE